MSTFIIAAAIICITIMVITICIVGKRLNEFLCTYKETNVILQESLGKILHGINKAHETTTAAIDSRLKENYAFIVDSISCLTKYVNELTETANKIQSMIEERKSIPIKVTLFENAKEPEKTTKKTVKKSKKEVAETKEQDKDKKDRDLYKEVMKLRKTMSLRAIAKHLGYKSAKSVERIINKGKVNNW